jgi:hypothetical protein
MLARSQGESSPLHGNADDLPAEMETFAEGQDATVCQAETSRAKSAQSCGRKLIQMRHYV